MKRIIATVGCSLLVLCPLALMAQTVTVPVGTVVVAKFIEDVQPSTVQQGDSVLLLVDKDVVVSGKTVIKEGARIRAEVADSKKSGYAGQSGRLLLTFRSVTAVDGQEIMLSGSSQRQGEDQMVESIGLGLVCCPLFLLMKGKEGIIKTGQTTQVYTVNAVNVSVIE